jgi:hypothetical protein
MVNFQGLSLMGLAMGSILAEGHLLTAGSGLLRVESRKLKRLQLSRVYSAPRAFLCSFTNL